MKRRLNAICFFLLLGLAAIPATAQQTRGITPEDYFAFEFLSDPHISPDGKLVAYVVTRVDRAQNRRNSAIWMVATDGSRAPWQFTTSPQSATSPRWSPDGRSLAFLSSRPAAESGAQEQPRPQVYLLSLDGGEARRVTSVKNGAGVFQWSPDGSRLVVVSRIGPSDSRPESKDRSDVRHYKDTRYKFNDTGWFDDRRSHLWVVDVKSGAAKQITDGAAWNDSDPQWSPDGTRIAFVSNRTGKEYEDNRNTDVWVVPAEGGALTKISDHDESDNSPRWSPDGKTIAFTGETHARSHPKIWLAGASSRQHANEARETTPAREDGTGFGERHRTVTPRSKILRRNEGADFARQDARSATYCESFFGN
jgi:dipeptidyl aminopeptidase/acylaminoacyl peptidase